MVGVAEVSFASVTRSTLLTLNPPSDSTYLCNMAVHDGYRRRGIAGHMLKALEACALSRRGPSDTVYLHLRLRDKPAGALYRCAPILDASGPVHVQRQCLKGRHNIGY